MAGVLELDAIFRNFPTQIIYSMIGPNIGTVYIFLPNWFHPANQEQTPQLFLNIIGKTFFQILSHVVITGSQLV